MVKDYKSELEKLNNNEEFQAYMTEEEAYKMQYNTDISDAFEEGIEKSKKETIINLRDMDMPTEDIAKAVNKTVEEVEEILKEC